MADFATHVCGTSPYLHLYRVPPPPRVLYTTTTHTVIRREIDNRRYRSTSVYRSAERERNFNVFLVCQVLKFNVNV